MPTRPDQRECAPVNIQTIEYDFDGLCAELVTHLLHGLPELDGIQLPIVIHVIALEYICQVDS